MAESENAASLDLYWYLYRYIVGSEKDVKTIRLMNTIRDYASSSKFWAGITSGSFGEGLIMEGSDFDVMFVLRDINVYETTNDKPGSSFKMDTDETKPGFTRLRLMHTMDREHFSWCVELSNKSNLYLSNTNFKAAFFHEKFPSVHGPCMSDNDQLFDIAYCLHSESWISQARQWVIRSNNSWPSETVKQTIIDHGVLFVPVGMKGSTNEEVEWRISFSVGEKFLIYTFNHTQMMCYAVMKIFLKDVIEADSRCKDLLCSYFLKTILFWVSEEIPFLTWSPNNILRCFMRCFKRLIFCVKYSLCPHYFIPENNLFENKIEGTVRKILLENLTILYSYGWRCILFSKQFSYFRVESARMDLINGSKRLKLMIEIPFFMSHHSYTKYYECAVKQICSHESSRFKYFCICFLANVCRRASQKVHIKSTSGNKEQYKQYRTCLSYILQDIGRDVVSRWLLLSSLLYRMKQYGKCLHILSYALSKFTPEKLYGNESKLSILHDHFLDSNILKNEFSFSKFKNHCLVYFLLHSSLIPNELEIEVADGAHLIPPVVFAHFLRFLCFYYKKDDKQCVDVAGQLLATIPKIYVIRGSTELAASFNCAGIVFQLLGDYDTARRCYMSAVECASGFNCALQRLQLLNG